MTIAPTHLTVGQLFGHNFIFRVSKYQRYYAWDSEEITDLLSDLKQCLEARKKGSRRHHFFGGLVTVSAPAAGSARQNIEVIDRQQRLASFAMLVAQLRQAMLDLAGSVESSHPDSPAKFLLDKAATLHDKYQIYKDTIGLQIVEIARLELSKPDKTYFDQLILAKNPVPERRSHRLLKAAYEQIGRDLTDLVVKAHTDTEKAHALALVDEVLEQDWTVIHMATDSRGEAYMLFQVLNDRGISLTEGELLRARTLEILESGGTVSQQQVVEEAWDHILGAEPERVDDGLRWVYASHVGMRPGKTTLFDEFLEAFFPPHRQSPPLGPADADAVVQTVARLRQEFERMAFIMQEGWPFEIKPPVTAWDRDRLRLLVAELKHTHCMPLLLAALGLDQRKFAEIVHILERFVFRYRIITGAHMGQAASIYHKHALTIRGAPTAYNVSALRQDLRQLINAHAKDDVFRNRLGDLRYSDSSTNKPVKYLLMTLEHYARWYNMGAKGRPKCLDKTRVFDFPNATVEHIHPQNASSSDPKLEPLVDTIGNLTFLGPNDNDAAGNKSFVHKRPILAASNILINQMLAQNNTSDEAAVTAHRHTLEEMAPKVFVV